MARLDHVVERFDLLTVCVLKPYLLPYAYNLDP